jgi:hypothetical protein
LNFIIKKKKHLNSIKVILITEKMVKKNNFILITTSLLVFSFLISFVSASHNVTLQGGRTSFNAAPNIGYVYNITINNSDEGGPAANITQVNITLWGNLNFVAGAYNSSRAPNFTFTNTSTVLSWNNLTILVNSTNNASFWFNATAPTSGTYNITITTLNKSGAFNTNVTLVVNYTVQFNGTIKDENGILLNNSVINITMRSMTGWSVMGYIATTTNASGWFNASVQLNGQAQATWGQWIYEPSITHTNSTYGFVDFKSKSIPAMTYNMLPMLAGTTFYLSPAGTLNITALNSSGQRMPFQYQIKDTKLGYPIAEEHSNFVMEADIYVPKNRNYSIMIYPNFSMPISFNWNNFSSNDTYRFNYNSSYNATSSTLQKTFNVSVKMARVTGFVLNLTASNWSNFTVIPYLLEPGNMIHAEYGDMPFNLSSTTGLAETDSFNLTRGFYNISIPTTAETCNIILFAALINNQTDFYGSFRNISLAYGVTNASVNFTNISILFGNIGNVTLDRMDGAATPNIAIPTKKQRFYLQNASNISLGNTSAHVEVTVDYSKLGASEFTWMTDIAQSSVLSFFDIPLLNATGFKEINVFASGGGGGSSQYAPRRLGTTTSANVESSGNITIRNFNPQDIDGTLSSSSIAMYMYISNSSCDVPNPPAACALVSSTTLAEFNPMQAVMGGGKISFRMGTGGILVHYVNADMLASGPPDALFDRTTSNASSGGTFDAALRFGSTGPTIYDYVLVSIPYTEGPGTGLNDSDTLNISIPVMYDDNWNVIWNVSSNGTSSAALAANNSHYSTYQSDWAVLMNQTSCTAGNITSAVNLNSTNPCYIDITNNRFWIRLPHFSGTGTDINGKIIPAPAGTSTASGGTSVLIDWTKTTVITDAQFQEGFTTDLAVKNRARVRVSSVYHYIGIAKITSTTATINIESPKTYLEVFNIGDEKKFDVNEDGYNDIYIKLNSIINSRVSLTFKSINEKIVAAAETPSAQPETAQPSEKEEIGEAKPSYGLWIGITAIVIIALAVILYFFVYRKKNNFYMIYKRNQRK